MNRRVVFSLLVLLLVVAIGGCRYPFMGFSSHTSHSEFFEDDLSNSYYATAGDLLKETMRTNDTEELAILHKRVIEQYNKIMKIHPNDPLILFNRGAIYSALGEYEKAIEDYNAFLLISPNDGLALENRGRAYELSGDIEGAYKDYKLVQLYLNRQKSSTTSPGVLSRFEKDLLRIDEKVQELEDLLAEQNKPIPEVKISEEEF